MKTANRFAKGSGLYPCRCCGRKTRATGRGDNEYVGMCAECYDLAGYENMVADHGAEALTPAMRETVRQHLQSISDNGGDPAKAWHDPELLVEAKPAKPANTEIVVTLHTPAGDVRSVYKLGQQDLQAMNCITSYLDDRKHFTVSYE